MTEERKKYLNGISKEERTIRNQIDYHKSSLKMKKWLTKGNKDEDGISLLKSEIAGEKIIIKTLKKQLPAPLLTRDDRCPICSFSHNDCVYIADYCCMCGQKLR